MIWGILTFILVGLVLIFAAPFLDFLAPPKNILLVDTSDPNNPVLLAQGSETLWFQWQSWMYIFLFCAVTTLVLGIVYNAIRAFSDKQVLESRRKLTQKTGELETLKQQYKREFEVEILQKHSQESERLDSRYAELEAMQHQNHIQKQQAQEKLLAAHHIARQQNRETQSKLGQRDRLRAEKKLLAEFIDQMDWKFGDGSKLTYNGLVKLARQHKHEK